MMGEVKLLGRLRKDAWKSMKGTIRVFNIRYGLWEDGLFFLTIQLRTLVDLGLVLELLGVTKFLILPYLRQSKN